MHLSLVVTRDDVASLIEEVTPLRVELSPQRAVSFGRPSSVELVPGAGLRLRGDARFAWDMAGLVIPVTLRAFQILLEPSIVVRDGSHMLAFDPVLERLDFKRLPIFLDGRIAEAINEGLAAHKQKLCWAFGRTLAVSRRLPDRVSPATRFELAPSHGSILVTKSELRLELVFSARFDRLRAPPAAPKRTASDENETRAARARTPPATP